jgi:hypothetical protein
VTVAYVCRLLPLTCLAPCIVEAILDGRQPKGLRLAEMLGKWAGCMGRPEGDLGLQQFDTACSEKSDLGAAHLAL